MTTHTTAAESTPSAEEATHQVLAAIAQMAPHLAHAYSCPASSAGPCTCGYAELEKGLQDLKNAHEAHSGAHQSQKQH
jgi:hypothetical protein